MAPITLIYKLTTGWLLAH